MLVSKLSKYIQNILMTEYRLSLRDAFRCKQFLNPKYAAAQWLSTDIIIVSKTAAKLFLVFIFRSIHYSVDSK